MKLENQNDQLMAMAAHRYCLGRQSYIVGACEEWLFATWKDISEGGRLVILRDTAQALMRGAAGSAYDAERWLRFLEWGCAKLSPVELKNLKRDVAYIKKPWPLDKPKKKK
jgi:hypothetical protein